jgi:hypothetical protein
VKDPAVTGCKRYPNLLWSKYLRGCNFNSLNINHDKNGTDATHHEDGSISRSTHISCDKSS